jgi:hypothetical protein
MTNRRAAQHSLESTNLADLLERLLDKGIVIAGDIKVSLVEVELLTLQIRLVICSVDKARELGMDWWVNHPSFTSQPQPAGLADSVSKLDERLARLESSLAASGA